jgi:erythromycin esterase-like protein
VSSTRIATSPDRGLRAALDAVRREARPLSGDRRDYDALMELIGDARIVLLGEASHGTHEFYRERARITKRLIAEHGFTALAIEGDWPDDSGRVLAEPRLERAIGVIYRPETERQSHCFAASAAQQFDALVHIDRTRAVEPLERTSTWDLGEPPETYPSAL